MHRQRRSARRIAWGGAWGRRTLLGRVRKCVAMGRPLHVVSTQAQRVGVAGRVSSHSRLVLCCPQTLQELQAHGRRRLDRLSAGICVALHTQAILLADVAPSGSVCPFPASVCIVGGVLMVLRRGGGPAVVMKGCSSNHSKSTLPARTPHHLVNTAEPPPPTMLLHLQRDARTGSF